MTELEKIATFVIDEAKKSGADQAEVSISTNKGYSVSAHNGDVETVEYHQDKVLEISLLKNKRVGAASLSDFRPEAIQEAVQAASHIAKYTDVDPASGLADKSEIAFGYKPIAMGRPWGLPVEEAIQLAIQCEREAKAYDKRIINAEQATVTTSDVEYVYANSLNFLGSYAYSRHEMSCILIGKEGKSMERDYDYTTSALPEELTSVSSIARRAAEKTIKRLGARKLRTLKAPVIFLAEEARGLIGHFSASIAGGSIYRKASFLVDQLGQKIFPDFMSIQEFPHLPNALGSAPFDDNGVATRENQFIQDGILASYALSVYSARKLGLKTTGNGGGFHNLTVSTGKLNLQELIKKMDKGLLVTETMGQGVNLITGDYSRGVGGFWVENGEIQYPVHEITVASRLQEMFAKIVDVGNDLDLRGNVRTGSILIEEMMIAGD